MIKSLKIIENRTKTDKFIALQKAHLETCFLCVALQNFLNTSRI